MRRKGPGSPCLQQTCIHKGEGANDVFVVTWLSVRRFLNLSNSIVTQKYPIFQSQVWVLAQFRSTEFPPEGIGESAIKSCLMHTHRVHAQTVETRPFSFPCRRPGNEAGLRDEF